jgi:hypothetical protein
VNLLVVVLAGALWTGTARVDVMNWEGAGEHPYQTDFALRIPLTPERIALKVWHQVRGLLNCIGAGQEEVTEDPGSAIVIPVRGETLVETVGVAIPHPAHMSWCCREPTPRMPVDKATGTRGIVERESDQGCFLRTSNSTTERCDSWMRVAPECAALMPTTVLGVPTAQYSTS